MTQNYRERERAGIVTFGNQSSEILAEIPDYLLHPQYQTREQRRVVEMEQSVKDLADLVKEM